MRTKAVARFVHEKPILYRICVEVDLTKNPYLDEALLLSPV